MPPVKGTKRFDMFKKDENTLPFFSFHPKTKLGTIVRIVWLGLMLLIIALSIVMSLTKTAPTRAVLLYILADPQSTFVILTAFAVIALVAIALFKRMPNTFLKMLVAILTVTVLLIATSVVSAMFSALPAMQIEQSGKTMVDAYSKLNGIKTDQGTQNLMVMYQYSVPDGSVQTAPDEDLKNYACPVRVDAYKVTASGDSEAESRGVLYVPRDQLDKLKVEWTDEDTAVISLAEENTPVLPAELLSSPRVEGTDGKYRYVLPETQDGEAFGSVTVKFAAQGEKSTEIRAYQKEIKSPGGAHSLFLHAEETYAYKPENVNNMPAESMKKILTAYPSLFFNMLIKFDVKTEGNIVIKPYAELTGVKCTTMENGVLLLEPSENTRGVSGSITVYLNEKATPNSDSENSAEEKSDTNE